MSEDADAETTAGKPSPEQEYLTLLDNVLGTNPHLKIEKLLENIRTKKKSEKNNEDKGHGEEASIHTDDTAEKPCVLSQTIFLSRNCIDNLLLVRDNLLSTFMSLSDCTSKTKMEKATFQLGDISGNLLNMVCEASSLVQKLHDTSLGLHVACDFLRNPEELGTLNFSKTGKISLSHFGCNEATSMCLTWLQGAAEKLSKAKKEMVAETVRNTMRGSSRPPSSSSTMMMLSPQYKTFIKIYTAFEHAISDLRDCAQLSSQVFRVLMYCSAQGKMVLQKYVKGKSPHEINDVIMGLQQLRRQLDDINIILEKLGMSLADIWSRCTGKEADFEKMRQSGFTKDGFKMVSTKAQIDKVDRVLSASRVKLSKTQGSLVNNNKKTNEDGLKKLKDKSEMVVKRSTKLESAMNVKSKERFQELKFLAKLETVFGFQSELLHMDSANDGKSLKRSRTKPKSSKSKNKEDNTKQDNNDLSLQPENEKPKVTTNTTSAENKPTMRKPKKAPFK